MSKVINSTKFNELIKEKKVVIVDFFATWCGACQMYGPVFEKYASKDKSVAMVKIDIDKDGKIAEKYNVSAVPTTIAFKDGKAVKRFSGFKQIDDLKKFVESVK